jgi:hypothetical protein
VDPTTTSLPESKTEQETKNGSDDTIQISITQPSGSEKAALEPTRPRRKSSDTSTQRTGVKTGIVITDLKPINRQIPFNRDFLQASTVNDGSTMLESGFFRSLTKNVKGLFEGDRPKGLEKKEIIRLRLTVGSLKNAKAEAQISDEITEEISSESNRPKTKKELLEEKHKALEEKSKTTNIKSGATVGIRIEIERLKKKYPAEPNLPLLSAVLTSKDACSIHRSLKERTGSLYFALQEAGSVVFNDYLTTYSIDVLFDIYFLYLETLKAKLLSDLRTSGSDDIDSIRRDLRVMNLLLDQKRLGRTIASIAKKLDGFGYPYESLSPIHVVRTYQSTSEDGDERIGPGTVKLNKFLVRIYLNTFSQIPAFHPLARKYCDVLPASRQSRAMIANVNVENAIIKFRIAKLNKSMELNRMIMSIYNYGKSYIGSNFAETVTSPLEAKLLLRIAQMVDEIGHISTVVDPGMLVYGYRCATIALHYFKEEAEALLTTLSDLAAQQRVELN